MLRRSLVCLLLLAACGGDEGRPPARPTYRAIAGFSMGAMGATFVGAAHPERFDAIGALGGPLDPDHFLGYLERAWSGGFCPLAELEAIAAADPAALDDPARLPCMAPAPPQAEAVLPEHVQSFVRWRYGDNGGSFDRDAYLDLFTDIALAFGNLLTFNPDSPFLPPGVTEADLARGDALCGDPVVLEGVYNAEYNPQGRHPVITFCDGEEPVLACANTGRVVDRCAGDPEAACAAEGGVETVRSGDAWREAAGAFAGCAEHRRPVPFALAVDINRNGRRDYGEPLLINAHERWEDVGADGCPNEREDGKGGCTAEARAARGDPNGDDYHWAINPAGTEGNWRWDPGEPFGDYGLDGVPGTGDFGEGDGRFTESPARARFRAHGPDAFLARWSAADRERIAFYADGGIRDLFNFGISAAQVWSRIAAARGGAAGAFPGLASLPGAPTTEAAFDPLAIDPATLPRTMLFLYGDPAASEAAIRAGDGDHVGTSRQLLNRFYLFLNWLSARWPELEDPPADRTGVHERTREMRYHSAALGAERNYTVVLPPGYDDPRNARARYPVLFLLHGYGMRPGGAGGFAESALLFDGAMASGRLRKMIVVFPSGRCCHEDGAGNRVCTDDPPAGFERMCRSGSFFVDGAGRGAGGGPAYGTAMLELLDEVDRRFRTLSARR